MFVNLWHGLDALASGPAIAYLIGGALIGMFVGVIPGLSTIVVLSIILAFVYHIDLTGTLCLFLGAHAGSYYSASISSILLNAPAHPEAFPITLDGYPMARKGQAGRALGLSAGSTCLGGFIGCLVLLGFLQIINKFPGLFHPPEYVALVLLSLLLVGTLGTDSVAKSVIAAGAGLMVASIGPSAITGTYRYTFNAVGLFSGISLVALALGVFAIPQMVMVYGTGTAVARQDMTGKAIDAVAEVPMDKSVGKQLIGGVFETFRHWRVLIQSGIVGGITGMIPGIGGFTGNFLAYGIAKETSKKRDQFGTGIPEGIVAPEGSSLAKEAGHMIPILGLGIAGGAGGALFLAALNIKGVRTGYGFTETYPTVGYEIFWILALSALIGTTVGVLIGPQLARITKVPGPFLVPFIFALAISGPFLADTSFFAVIEVVVFGVIGLGLRRLRYPLGAFILGLVLGPTFENNVYLTHRLYPGFTFLTQRLLADGIFLVALVALVAKALEVRRDKIKAKALVEAKYASTTNEVERAAVTNSLRLSEAPYPLLSCIASTLFLAMALFFLVYGLEYYTSVEVAMPVIGALLVAVPAALMLPKDIYRYVVYRKAKAERAASVSLASGIPNVVASQESATAGFVPLADYLVNSGMPTGLTTPNGAPVVVDKSWGRNGQYRRECTAYLWLFGLLGLCWTLGFIVATPVFVALYGLTLGKRYLPKLRNRLIFTVLSAAVMWYVTLEMFHLINLQFSPKIHF